MNLNELPYFLVDTSGGMPSRLIVATRRYPICVPRPHTAHNSLHLPTPHGVSGHSHCSPHCSLHRRPHLYPSLQSEAKAGCLREALRSATASKELPHLATPLLSTPNKSFTISASDNLQFMTMSCAASHDDALCAASHGHDAHSKLDLFPFPTISLN